MKKQDIEKIQKILEEAEKIASEKTIDKQKVAALSKEIETVIKPKKYFQRIA